MELKYQNTVTSYTFTSADTDVMAGNFNSICSNKKADVNFEIGINLVRNFGPPLRHINNILSTV